MTEPFTPYDAAAVTLVLDAARESSAAVVAEIHAELAEPVTRTEECPECGGDFPVDKRGTYTTHLIAWDGKPCRNEE